MTVVDGCDAANLGLPRSTYVNVGTATADGITVQDSSHYCHPPQPGLAVEKILMGGDVDAPNDPFILEIAVGETITWTYEVRNTGTDTYAQADIVVVDSDPTVTLEWFGVTDLNNDCLLSSNEVWIYQATSVAQDLRAPLATATVVEGCDPGFSGSPKPTYENVASVRSGAVGDSDPSYYCNSDAFNISIKNLTNGVDVSGPNAENVPLVSPGTLVEWTYVVTNTGNTDILLGDIRVTDSDPNIVPILDPSSEDNRDMRLSSGETWLYRAASLAHDLSTPSPDVTVVEGCREASSLGVRPTYQNIGTVWVGGLSYSAASYYCNFIPGIEIETFTNNADADGADSADVPILLAGTTVTWTYLVENTGDLPFAVDELQIADSSPAVIPTLDPNQDVNADNVLAPGETWAYRASGTVQDLATATAEIFTIPGCRGENSPTPRPTYENVGAVAVRDVTAQDKSHYCNPLNPGITIQKLTNGPGQIPADADTPNDADVPIIQRTIGGETVMVTWTYLITNSGDSAFHLTDIQVTDDDTTLSPTRLPSSDLNGDGILLPGESWTYLAEAPLLDLGALNRVGDSRVTTGCAQADNGSIGLAYRNIGTVTVGTLEAQDSSHYCSATPAAIDTEAEPEDLLNRQVYLPFVQMNR